MEILKNDSDIFKNDSQKMMQPKEIKALIESGMHDTQAFVEGDGAHFTAVVVSNAFKDQSRIQKQQLVYATLKAPLMDGSLHALSLKTYTPEEWQQLNHVT